MGTQSRFAGKGTSDGNRGWEIESNVTRTPAGVLQRRRYDSECKARHSKKLQSRPGKPSRKKGMGWVNKPDSVPCRMFDMAATMSLGPMLPQASSDLPENFGRANLSRTSPNRPRKRRPAMRDAGQAVRGVLLFGLAPGDAYPAIHVAMDAVGSYSTFSPLPRKPRPYRTAHPEAVCFLRRSCRIAPPGRYPAPCPLESGLSSHRPASRPASGRLTHAFIPKTMIRRTGH